jgi:protein-tyrosine phosphatase
MAEAVFRHKVKEAGLEGQIEVDSAGTGDWHIGEPPHRGTRNILTQNKISHSGITARQVQPEDLQKFDYIIAMDASNLRNLERLVSGTGGFKGDGQERRPHIARMLDFLPDSPVADVPDPYYTGNFEEVYDMIDRSCDRLLAWILERSHV